MGNYSNHKQFQAIFVGFLFLAVQISCVTDPLSGGGATEIRLSFNAGPYAGQTLVFTTDNAETDLRYYKVDQKTRVFCQPLHSSDGRNMQASSSINFAWLGTAGSGVFTTVNFQDPKSLNCGTIDLSYSDGEFLVMYWPSGDQLTIDEFNEPGNVVVGHNLLNGELLHEKNGQTKAYSCTCDVSFKIHRGADGN
ncbi:MAG: hypothetical protein U0V49_10510 [Saprospiraceae bacterium]